MIQYAIDKKCVFHVTHSHIPRDRSLFCTLDRKQIEMKLGKQQRFDHISTGQ